MIQINSKSNLQQEQLSVAQHNNYAQLDINYLNFI